MQRSYRFLSLLLAAVLAVGLVPSYQANPNVPYCEGSVAGTNAQRVIMPEVCEASTGRVFPEAPLAKDYVSFYEFEAGLEYLDAQYPDRIEIIEVARSAGLTNAAGLGADFPIYLVEVTNEDSPVPAEEKLQLLFMLSIHGNEKGGREGGFRVIEDYAKGVASAAQIVQNGAGMPQAMAKPTGGEVSTYEDYLDFTTLVFIFPNSDGWAHDEAEFVTTPCVNYLPTLFCRVNGNGVDLNRQSPTLGWHDETRKVIGEPETIGYFPVLQNNYRFQYAIDVHGMLNHENFAAVMMPAGSLTPQEMLRSTRIAEDLKTRLNGDDHFAAWTSSWQAAETAANIARGATCDMVDICRVIGEDGDALVGKGDDAVGSSEFADWSTVWDAIGYTDSGFHGDYFAQQNGLNAPGYDIELAYNHITVDSQYEGAGMLFNDYHIQIVRTIVHTFLDAAALDVKVSYETNAQRTLYVASQYVATNADDALPGTGGWAAENEHDDPWDYGADQVFRARPAKYFEDMVPVLRNGEAPGVLHATSAQRLTPSLLAQYDTLVIPGSAITQFYVSGAAGANRLPEGDVDTARVAMVLDWVKAGGNLVLTDAGLKFFDLAGLTENGVVLGTGYAGAINMDRTHELLTDVRGEVRQTFEPVPVGFRIGINSPIWGLDAEAFLAIDGDEAGRQYNDDTKVSLGRHAVGSGQIQFIGALLPDPSEEFYHPYGLDDYATTYSGNQILRNMLGWDVRFEAPPVVVQADGKIIQSPNEPGPGQGGDDTDGTSGTDGKKNTPLAPAVAFLALLGALAVAARRRQ